MRLQMFTLPKKYWRQLSLIGKLEYIKDEIKSHIYPYKTVRKLKDLWWEIKNIPFTLKKIWFFIPTLWNYHWYEYSFLLLWARSLEYNLKFYNSPNKVMMLEGNRKLIIRKMTELKDIFKRLREEDYPKLHVTKHMAIFNNSTPIISKGRIWGWKSNTKSSKRQFKLLKENWKHEDKLRKKDLKTIGKIIEKYSLTWWD